MGTFILAVLAFTSFANAMVIDTKYGSVRGKQVTTTGKDDKPAYAFKGIPYAAPPVGNLRFAPPAPPTSWTGIRNATKYGAQCPVPTVSIMEGVQVKSLGYSEDCLTLNVFAPEPTTGKGRAVLVFIHGGSLSIGTGAIYDGRIYATRHDVILVTLNYRLGLLGFLSTGDDVVPGNMGFLDQVAALKWVHENIAAFGGDPDRVTVAGESAGAWSVSFHVISPSSEGLFSRAIYQSGSLVDSTYIYNKTRARVDAEDLANYFNCPNASSAMLSCLREQSLNDILTNLDPRLSMRYWMAVIDGTDIPYHPSTMIQKKDFQRDIDVLAGVCDTEGYFTMSYLLPGFNDKPLTEEQFRGVVRHMLYLKGQGHWSEETINSLTQEAIKVYGGKSLGDILKRHLVDFVGDNSLAYPTISTALAHTNDGRGKVYFYRFTHRISSSKKPYWITADHGDDIWFTFGFPTNSWDTDMAMMFNGSVKENPYNLLDVHMDNIMTTYWANFVKNGNPNGAGLIHWKEFSRPHYPYMTLQLPPIMSTDYNMDRVKFWRDTVGSMAAGADTLPHNSVSILLTLAWLTLQICL